MRTVVGMVGSLLCVTMLQAEVVRLKNGDVVSGDIVSMDSKSLKLKSDNFGDVLIDRSRVATIRFGATHSSAWRVPMRLMLSEPAMRTDVQREDSLMEQQPASPSDPNVSSENSPQVRLTITGPAEVPVGKDSHVTVVLENTDTRALANARLAVEHSNSLVPVAGTKGFQFAKNGMYWTVTDVPAGVALQRRISFKALKVGAATIQARMTADGDLDVDESMTVQVVDAQAGP